MSPFPTVQNWVETIQAQGIYTFTRSEAETGTSRSFTSVQSTLRRLKKKGRIVSPRRGFYVIVPPEYRATGSPPASWFIDALMRDLDQPYYVGLLSAAALHGSAHQQPMVFQVMTSRPTRAMRAGKVTIQFTMRNDVERMPVSNQQTETGTMRVATPETTAFDLVRYPATAGHLSNVATVLAELAERLDPETLVRVASLVRLPDVQRLGYLLEYVGAGNVVGPLFDWLDTRCSRTVRLGPGVSEDAEIDGRWRVRSSTNLEVEL